VVPSLINWLLDDVELETGEETTIMQGCNLGGHIILGDHVRIGADSYLVGDIEIGRGTGVNRQCEIFGDVEIGRHNAIAPHVLFRQTNHQTQRPSLQGSLYSTYFGEELKPTSKGKIIVGSDVWIGTRSTILSGVTIGHGAIVGAESVVTEDVEPYSVVGGSPARHIKWRFPETIRDKLLDLAWWEWSPQKIEENTAFFSENLYDLTDQAIDDLVK
jgi:virginiamycin A acetyltransferase